MPNPKSPASTGSGCLILFALPFAGVGVFMAIWMGSTLLTWHRAQSWAEVPARILSTELKESHGNRRNKSTTYKVIAEYAYEYYGQKYTGHDIGLYGGGSNQINSFPQDAYRELSEYQKTGKPFHCYVNPAQPEQAFLYRDLDGVDLMLRMIFGLGFGGGGFGLMIAGVRGLRKERSRAAFAETHPEMPWIWKSDLAAGQIVYSSKRDMVFAVILATFGNLAAVILLLLLLPLVCKGNPVAWFLGLLFPVIGLGLIVWAIVEILRWR
jgi:hypothetical protein